MPVVCSGSGLVNAGSWPSVGLMLARCWVIVGPASKTVGRHGDDMGSSFHFYFVLCFSDEHDALALCWGDA